MKCKAYPSDLTNAEWLIAKPLLPADKGHGRPREVDLREVCNGIFYVLKTGCQWQMLPHDFPPKSTIYEYFARWREDGTWVRLNEALRVQVRLKAGKDPEASAGIIDSQSVKTTEIGGVRGYDAGKQVKGRKRHLLVDTMGLLLIVLVHTANIQDRDGAKLLFAKIIDRFPRLQLIWADGGYAGKLLDWVKCTCHWVLEIVKRSDDMKGFQVLPHRWIVERTISWLSNARRLSKDYEYLTESSEAFIYAAMTRIMLRRLTRVTQA